MKNLALTLPSLSPLTSGWRQRFFLLLSIKPTWCIIFVIDSEVHEKGSGITSGSGSPCAAQYVVNLRNSSITFSISGIVLGAGLLGHIL